MQNKIYKMLTMTSREM